MMEGNNRIQAINRYLNGDLNKDEQTAFEEAYFVDNELFLMLLAVDANTSHDPAQEVADHLPLAE